MRFSTVVAAAAAAGSAYAQDMANQTVCDKYTVALLMDNTAANQMTLLTLLVKTVVLGNFTGPGTDYPDLPGSMVDVPGILAPGEVNGTAVDLLGYFNGSLLSTNRGGDAGESVNFLDGGNLTSATDIGAMDSMQNSLLSHLIQFFGAALGCSQYGMEGYPAYSGTTSMASVHQYMGISNAENTYFVQQVGLAASSFGAEEADVTAVGMLLLGLFNQRCAPPAAVLPSAMPEYQVICIDESCPLATDAESTCASSSAGFGTFVATEPSTASSSGDMTSMPTTTDSMSSSGTEMSMPTTTGAGSSMPSTSLPAQSTGTDGNFAPRQTAAAGVMAMAGLVAAAFL